jgi:hypothetical protein
MELPLRRRVDGGFRGASGRFVLCGRAVLGLFAVVHFFAVDDDLARGGDERRSVEKDRGDLFPLGAASERRDIECTAENPAAVFPTVQDLDGE